ncbi:Uncharacterised protein [Mycobacteroides abscessus subsp. abscessus]|nr:Uncharacterised protein [Mycobacteroides abscessus subsp. abscessus]
MAIHADRIWLVSSSATMAFHILAKLLSDRRSRARSSRRRLAHSGSSLRPRRSRRSQVTRRRTFVSASLASLTRWK